jgi:glycosyltransferase involved in cell wall biosynthesis
MIHAIRRRPKILYIITRAERGGAQNHVLDLACSMRDQFEVAVATGERGFLTDACGSRSIPVHIVPRLQRRISPITDARAIWEIRQMIRRVNPSLIHAHTFKAGFLGRFAARVSGVPSIYTLHTWLFGTPAMPRLWSVLGGPCERLAAGWGDHVITVSEEGARVVQRYRIAPPSKVVTIYNGIPDCAEHADLDAHEFPVVTMVARFTEVKEHDVLLRAFAKLAPGPRLRLVGDGPLRAVSERLAQELGIGGRVEFLGDRGDVPALLADSDLFVLASKFEMLPISILEGMRAGLPIIASDVGGVREVIADGKSGFLVKSGSVSELSKALKQVTGDKELRVKLGWAARKRFCDKFLYARQEERTRSLYLNVLYGAGAVDRETEWQSEAA